MYVESHTPGIQDWMRVLNSMALCGRGLKSKLRRAHFWPKHWYKMSVYEESSIKLTKNATILWLELCRAHTQRTRCAIYRWILCVWLRFCELVEILVGCIGLWAFNCWWPQFDHPEIRQDSPFTRGRRKGDGYETTFHGHTQYCGLYQPRPSSCESIFLL